MRESKTTPTEISPADYMAAVENRERRADAQALAAVMAEVSGEPAAMWGPSMIGFGKLRYVHPSGRSGEMFRIGFSPRKPHLVLYGMNGAEGSADLIARLGKIKTDGGCIYIARLAQVDAAVLRALVDGAWQASFVRGPADG
ncbi:hypothetical protein BH11PSE2_BH11PSE2_12220 [soil metagenome]